MSLFYILSISRCCFVVPLFRWRLSVPLLHGIPIVPPVFRCSASVSVFRRLSVSATLFRRCSVFRCSVFRRSCFYSMPKETLSTNIFFDKVLEVEDLFWTFSISSIVGMH